MGDPKCPRNASTTARAPYRAGPPQPPPPCGPGVDANAQALASYHDACTQLNQLDPTQLSSDDAQLSSDDLSAVGAGTLDPDPLGGGVAARPVMEDGCFEGDHACPVEDSSTGCCDLNGDPTDAPSPVK